MTPTWTDITPATRPSARGYARMAMDPVRNEVVLFGGSNGSYSNETWVLNLATRLWTQKFPVHTPPARGLHGMAWDAVSQSVAMFGGFSGLIQLNDTWLWNGTDWTEIFPANKPSTRNSFAMCTAPGLGEVLLFGGIHFADINPNAETWTLDTVVPDWTHEAPATSPSPGRQAITAAYDPPRSRCVFYGGIHAASTFQDVWGWYGSTWADDTPATTPTDIDSDYMLAYSPSCQAVAMFGGGLGGVGGSQTDQTWFLTTDWAQQLISAPAARLNGAMCDQADPTPLVGGYPGPLDDTWLLNCPGIAAIRQTFGLG